MDSFTAGDRVVVVRDKSGAGYTGAVGTVVSVSEVWAAPDNVQVVLDAAGELIGEGMVLGFDADELRPLDAHD